MILKKYIHLFLLFFWGTIIVLYLVKPIFNKYDSKDNNPKLIKKDKEKEKKTEEERKKKKTEEERKKKTEEERKKKKEEDDKKKKKEEDDKKKKTEEERKKKTEEERKKKTEEERKKKTEEERKKKKKEKDDKKKKKEEDEKKKKEALSEDDIVEYDDGPSYDVITDDEDDDISVKVHGTTVCKGMLMEHPSDNLKIKNPYNKAAIDIALGIINDNKSMNENILKNNGCGKKLYTFKLNQSDDNKDIITINNYDNYKK